MFEDDISLCHIEKAYNRISPYIHKTPVFTSATFNQLSGRNLYFKAECLQKTGSFKARGACNAVLSLKEKSSTIIGVVTHSSGNHGQGLAYAAKIAGIPCTVVAPTGTSKSKCDAIRGYGSKLIFCDPTQTSRHDISEEIATKENLVLVHPYDNYDVMAGQGTVAYEFLQQVPHLDAIVVPVSGGGLTSGIAVAAKAIKPECKVFVAEPEGKNLQPCLETGSRLWTDPPQMLSTVAEGIRTQQVGKLTFPIINELVEKTVFTVSDQEMIDAQKLVWERMKIVIETASAAPVAAVLSQQMKTINENIRNVGIVISGGNATLDDLPWLKK